MAKKTTKAITKPDDESTHRLSVPLKLSIYRVLCVKAANATPFMKAHKYAAQVLERELKKG